MNITVMISWATDSKLIVQLDKVPSGARIPPTSATASF